MCTDCVASMPLITKAWITALLCGTVVGVVMGGGGALSNCPSAILDSYGLRIYSLLTAPLVSNGILNGLFGVLFMFQVGEALCYLAFGLSY
jgi:hypothetical protein